MKPFLFLAIRAQDAVADDEYAAMLRCCGLPEQALRRVRVERDELPDVDLADFSGVIVGGGPWNVSDAASGKGAAQVRGEAWLRDLARRVVAADFPFLGACYGIGTLGVLAGGVVDRTFAEPIGAVQVTLTTEGRTDAVLGGLPETFWAFVGHREAVSTMPRGAVLLAGSASCPVQAFRIGQHVYATQFHPELEADDLVRRIEAYRGFGYYGPGEEVALVSSARAAVVTEPSRVLAAFADRYARQAG